ncbi:MAG: RdgB/HAM1 family non-canonical purine NTP pyrophosphatase [Roseovarius sp.]|nr:RdgB/HAM1 family non-canonical purine NTP pyrophosphatase [Roseovarius sp.]
MRKFTGGTILVATHNSGKLEEMESLLNPYDIVVRGAADFNLPEPEEYEDTFAGNARIKARCAMEATGLPALADDSGVEIDALGGAPGVHTADWAETENGRDFIMAMKKTRGLLVQSATPEPWTARFCCALVLAWPDGHDEVFSGNVEGKIVWPMRGEQGHGYDPVFQPDGYNMTFGEMDPGEKNRISHRAVAFSKMVNRCFV